MTRFLLVLALLLGLSGLQPVRADETPVELTLTGPLVQGGMVLGKAPPGSEVKLGERSVRLAPDGLFVIGFDRDSAARLVLSAKLPDGRRIERPLAIEPRRYDVQRIEGLPQNTVTPSQAEVARINSENAAIAAARRRDTPETWFAGGFRWPANGRISGVYGSQRILNGEPRRPHFGLDIVAPVGTPIMAPAPGIVVLAERDLFFTGGTVMLDHGHGVTSVYSHLSAVDVSVGARLETGQVLGALGATGRVTGAHLDWRVSWFEVPLDPQLLVGPMPGD